MHHQTFAIIQSICRIGLGSENPAFRKQVERLKDRLEKEELASEAESIEKLLRSAARPSSLQPSKISLSPSFAGAEALTATTAPPSDRETGAALAEIAFPTSAHPTLPLLDQALQSAVESLVQEWQNSAALLSGGITPPSTILIYGLPGTGKTSLATSIASMLGLPLVTARLDGLISSFLGTTGRNIGNLFSFANRYRCILLLDEFDAVAKARDDSQEIGEIKRVVNAILQNIDGRRPHGLTIAITNHEQLLDSAVWRRFDVRLAVPKPAIATRMQIVDRYLNRSGRDDATAKLIAWLTEGMTGSDIETMTRTIRRHQILNPGATLLASLRYFAVTQATRGEARYARLLAGPTEDLAREALASPDLEISQRKLAQVLGISQSKLSRSLQKKSPR